MSGAGSRAIPRNVFFFDFKDPLTLLGGLYLTPGITNANFHSMIDITVVISSSYFLQNDNGETIPRDSQPLLPGNYYIIADGTVNVSDEVFYTRTMSMTTGTRIRGFKDQVRQRDRRCVVTKLQNPAAEFGVWAGFEATHIFPLAYEEYWNQQNFSRWITIPATQGGAINSVQNGLLLQSSVHQLFDIYSFSINPDDNYKIVCFLPDTFGIANTFLDRQVLDNAWRPVDEPLRWHFRQAVLANVRGAGEPVFDHDFPPGSDIMGDITGGPKAAERMESELFGRLAAHTTTDPCEET